MNRDKYILYFDDTGNRYPGTTFRQPEVRKDGMNCFGLGGMLIKEEDVQDLLSKHESLCSKWQITYPLHSSKIRGGRGEFSWLRTQGQESFVSDLESFILSLNFVGIACIVDRPRYLARYEEQYKDRLWYMCKTTFCILIERAAKFAYEHDRDLEIYFEQSGKMEDRNIIEYMRDLKRSGNQFDIVSSNYYEPLDAIDYRNIVRGEPQRLTKKSPLIQVADLVLYPIAKGGYDQTYGPYRKLYDSYKLIDCFIPEVEKNIRGVKYSCFNR